MDEVRNLAFYQATKVRVARSWKYDDEGPRDAAMVSHPFGRYCGVAA
jgi:hypothetical protein